MICKMDCYTIYKLQCNDGYYYIGRTSVGLKCRLQGHIRDSENIKYQKTKVYSHINSIGWNNVRMETLIEVDTKEKARAIEDELIRKHLDDEKCLNTKRGIISDKERLKVVEEHRTKLQSIKHKTIVCKCGYITTHGRLQQHTNSQKHKLLMLKLAETTPKCAETTPKSAEIPKFQAYLYKF